MGWGGGCKSEGLQGLGEQRRQRLGSSGGSRCGPNQNGKEGWARDEAGKNKAKSGQGLPVGLVRGYGLDPRARDPSSKWPVGRCTRESSFWVGAPLHPHYPEL